jgi:hypothetical protein
MSLLLIPESLTQFLTISQAENSTQVSGFEKNRNTRQFPTASAEAGAAAGFQL